MDTFESIRNRRSIRQYDPSHHMSEEEIEQLLGLGMLAPTALNLQHWRFVVVRDPDLRRQIRQVAMDQAQVTDASLFLVLCADCKAWEKEPERYWREAPAAVRETILPAIEACYRDKEQLQRDEAIRSCGMAAQTLMLAAKAMGYDSCPITGFDFEAVGRLINLPADHLIVMSLAIGKGTADPGPAIGRLSLSDVMINDRF